MTEDSDQHTNMNTNTNTNINETNKLIQVIQTYSDYKDSLILTTQDVKEILIAEHYVEDPALYSTLEHDGDYCILGVDDGK